MDDLFSVGQVAILLKVHPLTVRRYIREGKLKAKRVGGNVRISKTDLDQFTLSYTLEHPTRVVRRQQSQTVNFFTEYDPIFRIKGRGAS